MRYLGKGSVASFLGVMLNIAWYFLFIAMGFILIGALTVGFIAPNLIPRDWGSAISFDTEFIRFGFSQLKLVNPQGIILGILGLSLVMFMVAQAVIYQLRKIFATLRAGAAFTLENARRVRAIGLIIIGGSIVQSIVSSIVGWLIVYNTIIPGVELSSKGGLRLEGILFGLVMPTIMQF